MDTVLDNTKKYEDIAEKRSVFYHDIDRALSLVQKFIKKKDRILYGGMAIDISLKLSDHEGIYSPGTIPDYDFMSPDYYNDSNELAIELTKAGFENVSAIHAIHLTSRRVRVNFIPVADITYIPQNIYETIPTLIVSGGKTKELKELENMRVVHPNFQRLDIYRALCTPFEKPPGEVILQRTKKDIKRFRMLNKQYPLVISTEVEDNNVNTFTDVKIPKAYLQNAVAGGFLAYALLYEFWKVIASESQEKVIPLECFIEADEIIIKWPQHWKVDPLFCILTDFPINLASKIKKDNKSAVLSYHNKYLDDLRPRSIIVGEKYELFDNYGRESPVFNLMKLLNKWFEDNEEAAQTTQNIYICQSYYVMLYFLLKAHEDTKNSEFYTSMHNSIVAMISDVESISVESDVPFFLTDRTYGEANWSPDYMLSTKEKLLMLKGQKVSLRGPFGFYPKPDDILSTPPVFDPSQGDELFLIDGKKNEKPFKPLEKYFDI